MARPRFFSIVLLVSISLAHATMAQGILADDPVPVRLIVVSDDNYPPYIFRNRDGKLQGIVVDQWTLWSKRTGIPVDLQGMEWSKALRAMREGRADVLDTAFRTAERETWLAFSRPWAQIKVPVFFHKSISGIATQQDLVGFPVAAKDGDACVGVLQSLGVENIRLYPSYEAIVVAAAAGIESLFCIDEPPALYLMFKDGIAQDFRSALNLYTGYFHRATALNNTALLKLVEQGFALISADENATIDTRWFGLTLRRGVDQGLLIFLAIIACIALFAAANLAFMAIVLRKRVDSRTRELAQKIAQLQASEARLSAIVNVIPDLLFIFDANVRFSDFFVSTTARPLMPPEYFIGKTSFEVFGDNAVHEATRSAIHDALAGKGMQIREFWLPAGQDRIWSENRFIRLGDDRVLCLAMNRTEQKLAEEMIRASLAEKEALLKEIHHRVKNNLQIISSLLSWQAEKARDQVERDLFAESQGRIRSMSQVHELLYRSENLGAISVREYVHDLAVDLAASWSPSPGRVRLLIDSDEGQRDVELDQAVPLGLILNELISNAYKYAFPNGRTGSITVSIHTNEDDWTELRVNDDGVGLADGVDPIRTGGMGYSIVTALTEQIHAEISVSSKQGVGVCVTLRIPLRRMVADQP
ncbi:MAG: transporter substrate-binding domain-containing protein [Spirochaetales bacterium]|nr:MAG: transporter substrate-binding domain-containing protein [Spirochaetales bacterium]